MSEQLALLPGYLTAHLQLTLVALLFGTAGSLPLGIWVTRHPRAESFVLGIAGVTSSPRRVAEVTVSEVLPWTFPDIALIVVVPAANDLARP